MSLDELKERIKAEVVLREGDLFEWQWRQLGLVTEAEEVGVPADEFLALVNDVSRAINPYFGRISDLKIKVTDLARLQRKKLTDRQIDQIVAEATRLQLLPDFVKERWLPAIVSAIPEPTEETEERPPVSPTIVPTAVPDPLPPSLARPAGMPAAPIGVLPGVDREAVSRKVHQFLDDYVADKIIPIRVLKPLFLATNFDETLLADAILAYLSVHFYAAETPVQGASLKDKLLSTDWRHLSWWAPAPRTLAAQPAISPPARPAGRSSSDSSVIVMALVVVGLLIGAVWWATGGKSENPPKTATPRVQHTDTIPPVQTRKKPRRKARTGQHESKAIDQ